MKAVPLFCLLFCASLVALAADSAAGTGKKSYEKHCVFCHAADGSGHTAAATKMHIPDLRARGIAAMNDQQMIDSVGKGVGHTQYPHAYLLKKEMSANELNSVIAYMRGLQQK